MRRWLKTFWWVVAVVGGVLCFIFTMEVAEDLVSRSELLATEGTTHARASRRACRRACP
jgi:hypothetical protein